MLHDKAAFTASEEHWPTRTRKNPAQARDSCAVIRHALGKQGLPEDEHFFFRREMGFAGQIGTPWQRLPYLLFRWLSNYGYAIDLPVKWLLALWAVGFAAFFGYFVQSPPEGVNSPFWSAVAISFSNLFPVFGFSRTYYGYEFLRELPTALIALGGVQTVFSLPLLFFLGLGLRTRFRLR